MGGRDSLVLGSWMILKVYMYCNDLVSLTKHSQVLVVYIRSSPPHSYVCLTAQVLICYPISLYTTVYCTIVYMHTTIVNFCYLLLFAVLVSNKGVVEWRPG